MSKTVTVTATPEWIAGDIVAMSQRISSTAERDNIVKMLTGYLTRVSRTPAESAADDLLAACKAANKSLAEMAARGGWLPGEAGVDEWCRVQQGLSAAIARAEGGAQ